MAEQAQRVLIGTQAEILVRKIQNVLPVNGEVLQRSSCSIPSKVRSNRTMLSVGSMAYTCLDRSTTDKKLAFGDREGGLVSI